MFAERRWLGIPHVLEPLEVRVGDPAERRWGVRGAGGGVGALCELALDLPHDAVLRDDRSVLVQEARPRSPATAHK